MTPVFALGLFLVPFLVSLLLTALLIRWAPKVGLIDEPGARKVHSQPTPRGGGLAIYFAMLLTVGWLTFNGLIPRSALGFLLIAAIVVLLGLLDDWLSLSWQVRLLVQVAATLLTFGWPPDTGWLPWPLALIWVVGLVNAFNMLDNMDELSAGTAWIAALVLLMVLLARPVQEANGVLYFVFLGAVAGFLWFNRTPARIFMGDAGSTFLGFFLAVSALHGDLTVVPSTWAVLAVFAVPWYDLITVVALRLRQGRSPFHADKQHLSHRLVDRGLDSRTAVRVIHGLTLASGLGGLLLVLMPEWSVPIAVGIAALWLVVALLDFAPRAR